ncbi:hypothetical protein RND81_04G008000 [Saponaria officinalis]|uniref:Uncharacterized protein n=1 Tax=Saponaria officinalis TaxID=3572 RepID=A0AAW1LH90_SAPOF
MHMNNMCSKPLTNNGNVSRERDNAVKVAPRSSSESMQVNNLRSKPVTDNENVSREKFDDAKKPVLRVCEVETLSASINKDGSERNSCKVTSDCLDDVVVLDSDEVVMIKKTGNKNLSRRSGKKVKRKFGDSADYPLYVAEQIRRVDSRVKRSGISIEHPIDVENCCHYSD